jgi:hypothetical protein
MSLDVMYPTPAEDSKPLSRYRSVRMALSSSKASSSEPQVPPIPHQDDDNGFKRSMSRYHRARAGTATSHTGPAVHPTPDNHTPVPVPSPIRGLPPPAHPSEQHSSPRNRSHTVGAQHPPSSTGGASSHDFAKPLKRPTTSHKTEHSSSRHRSDSARVRTEGHQLLADEAARRERLRAQQEAQRQIQQAQKDAKKKADELERRQRAKETAEADKLRWKDIAKEEQRQKEAAEERRRAARQREDSETSAQRDRAEAESREIKRRIDRERPKNIMAPSKAQYDAVSPGSPPMTETPTSSTPSSKKFGFFKRRKGDESPMSPMSPPKTDGSRPKTSRASPKKANFIKPGGGGIVPLNDAPVSAVNHGDRRVRIECGRSFATLPVTPTTSALQLIRSASTVMSENIDPRAAVMSEVFSKAGVRRPLRMYEHIRDVMNSWDDDEQHSLVIEPSSQGADNELYVSFTPKQKPGESSWWMQYSHKPGKWEKKWVTLRSDGQITLAKNESGKDVINVCHMSDFDIYSPTHEARKKRIRPPKKHCYAIKSQQKSTMFLTTTNFIHLFCSNDPKDFFTTIQAWRSWYLVHVMGEGQASKGEQRPVDGEKAPDKSKLHTRTASAESHYILGSFNTLDINFDSIAKPEPEAIHAPRQRRSNSFSDYAPLASFGLMQPSALAHSKAMHTRNPSQRQRPNHPPLAFRNLHDSGIGNPGTNHRPSTSYNSQRNADQDGSFNPKGLLGTQYEQRQQNMQQGHRPSNDLHRSTSIRSTRSQRRNSLDAGALERTTSVRAGLAMPKPLVDLTPQYKEPPQFQKKGKGYKPDGSGTLIDSATSPDNAIVIPPSQDWRARPTTSAGPDRGQSVRHHQHNFSSSSREPLPAAGPGASQVHDRTKSLKGHGVKMHGQGNSLENADAFTGGGLLANSGPGWGGGDKGRGVLSGNRAKGPMLDMTERSKFAAGSLLGKVESGSSGGNGGR